MNVKGLHIERWTMSDGQVRFSVTSGGHTVNAIKATFKTKEQAEAFAAKLTGDDRPAFELLGVYIPRW